MLMMVEILMFMYCSHLLNDIKLRILIKLRNVRTNAFQYSTHAVHRPYI